MKRLSMIAGIIIILIIAGIAAINIKQADTDITKQQTKVGFILNGVIDDAAGDSLTMRLWKSAGKN